MTSAASGAKRMIPEEATVSSGSIAAELLHLSGGDDLRMHIIVCIICDVKFTWDETKRQANIARHGLDFADAEKVFAGPMVLFEDDRADYGEQRMIGIGLLDHLIVLIVHVETDNTIRIISMRKAERDEADLYYQNVGYF
jgi:uncharacterized protein